MKNKLLQILLIVLMFGFTSSQAGCEDNDGPIEKVGESLEDAGDEVGDALEDAGDEINDAVDEATE